MRSDHRQNVALLKSKQLNELLRVDKAKEEDTTQVGLASDTASMSIGDAYKTLGLRPGAEREDMRTARRKKVRALQAKGADQAEIDQVSQAARVVKMDTGSKFNEHGQRIDEAGNVVETWGEKFDRWVQTAKGWFGQDRPTQIAKELADLNEDRDEDQFEAALAELKYQLKRYPKRADQIANAYLKASRQEGGHYNDEVIETLKERLPDNQELVRAADGTFEIRQKESFTQVDGPQPNYEV